MVWLLALAAAAQNYSFPTSWEDYGNFYPTAYYDHSGEDWICGSYQYSGHQGSDFGVGSWDGMAAGRDVTAAAEGTVYATNDGEYDECSTGDCDGGGGYGNYVMIEHPDGKLTVYGHLKKWTVAVSAGQAVECGDKLGEVGSSGHSTGPHLHFEVRTAGGERVDPFHGDCSSTDHWVDQGAYMDLPAISCEDIGPCEPVGELSCGDAVSTRNDASGSTEAHWDYGCSEFTYSGPEIAWWFATDRDEPVTFTLTGLSADLDMGVLEGRSCDGGGCLGWSENSETSDESVTFDATAGHTYVIVVDGWEGATSSFSLGIACEGRWPGGADDTAGDDTAGDDTAGDDTGSVEETYPHGSHGHTIPERGGPEPGCGCGGRTGGAWWLALWLVVGRRRGDTAAWRGGAAYPSGSTARSAR